MQRRTRNPIHPVLLAIATAAALAAGCEGQVELALRPATPMTRAYQQYMLALVDEGEGQTVQLDLSNDIQYRFVMDRLAASGKMRSNAPQLYASLDALRAHGRLRNTATSAVDAPSGLLGDHFVSDFLVVPGESPDVGGPFAAAVAPPTRYEAGAFATTTGGSDYSFVDVIVWDDRWAPLSGSWDEAYGTGTKLVARSNGRLDTLANSTFIDSLHYVEKGGVAVVSYTVLQNVVPIANGVAPDCELPNDTVYATSAKLEQPFDRNSDGVIKVCLDRNSGDCDYTAFNGEVTFALQGSMLFGQDISFLYTDQPDTYVKLSDADAGGTMPDCSASPVPGICRFGEQVSTSGSGVSWKIVNPEADFGGQIPFQSSEELNFFLKVTVALNDDTWGIGVISTLQRTTEGDTTYCATEQIPPFQIVYSCLAAGTQIAMADGTTMNVEDVAKGGQVVTDMSAHPFEVADTSIGVETIPMVRIRDESGRTLLMTETHPIMTADRDVVWASELKVGSVVMTDTGPSVLVAVEREAYGGNVYNLELDKGADPMAAASPIQGSTMYANGFVVGDLDMQHAYTFKNADQRSERERTPAAWRADYERSPKR